MRKIFLALTFLFLCSVASAAVWLDGIKQGTGGSGSLNNIVEDTTPQLGGDLDAQGFDISNLYTVTANTVYVDCEAYDSTGWNGSTEAPCQDAVRDKIETIVASSGGMTSNATVTYVTEALEDFAVGGNTVAGAAFYVDESAETAKAKGGFIVGNGADADTNIVTVDLASTDATFTYVSASDEFQMNRPLNINASGGLTLEQGLIVNNENGSAVDNDFRANTALKDNFLELDSSAETFFVGGTVTNYASFLGQGTLRFTGNAGLRIPNSTSLPSTCEVGQIYMDTNATTGQRVYACESSNTWALQGDGGGGSGDITGVGDCSTGECFNVSGTGNSLVFEGSTADSNELTLTAEDPGTDVTLTLISTTGYIHPFNEDFTITEDVLAFYDLSSNRAEWLRVGDGLTISAHTISTVTNLRQFSIVDVDETSHDSIVQLQWDANFIASEICCSTNSGTVSVSFDARGETTPNTTGTTMLSAGTIGCDSNQQCTTSFADAMVASNSVMNMLVSATASSTQDLRVTVKGAYE